MSSNISCLNDLFDSGDIGDLFYLGIIISLAVRSTDSIWTSAPSLFFC